MYEPKLERRTVEVAGRPWDSRAAILLMEAQARDAYRRAVQLAAEKRRLVSDELRLLDLYAQASIAESLALDRPPAQALDYLLETRSRNFNDFSALLSPATVETRLAYEELCAGRFLRSTAGFADDPMAIEVAQRATNGVAAAAQIYMQRFPSNRLAFGLGEDATFDKPCFRYGERIYPVSMAGWVIARSEILGMAAAIVPAIAEWDDSLLRREDCAVDARNEMLVAEGIVRGYDERQIAQLVLADRQDACARRIDDVLDPSRPELTWLRALAAEFAEERYLVLVTAQGLAAGRDLLARCYAAGVPLSEAKLEVEALIAHPIPQAYREAAEAVLAARALDVASYADGIRIGFASGLSPSGAVDALLCARPVKSFIAERVSHPVREPERELGLGHGW